MDLAEIPDESGKTDEVPALEWETPAILELNPMPTYEYACTNCGVHLEAIQGFADAPLEACERCGGRLKRVFHPVGVLFKGSGFYSTDSKSRKKDGSAHKKELDSDKSDSSTKETKSTPTKTTSSSSSSSSSSASD